MKKIAITQRLIKHESYNEIREALDVNYCKLVRACGFLPIVLPYEIDFKEYFSNIQIDGVLFTGGNDLNECTSNHLSKKRDDFEKQLIEYCINMNLPIFGICRGLQILSEYFNSTFKKIENQINIRHKLIINQKSKYYNLLNCITEVNAYHTFGIDNLSNKFIESATDEKGNIKAIEHKSLKIFGQMWHSEREEPFNCSEINLIKEFFK